MIVVHSRTMRACFLGQNICALGFGVATLQTPRQPVDEQTDKPVDEPARDQNSTPLPPPPSPPVVHNTV